MRPFRGGGDGGGVWCVFERVVLRVDRAVGDGIHLTVDGDKCIAEAIELGLGFAFGGLDHERAGHGEGHRGRVVTVIDQALGDVFDFDALLFPRTELQDAFMRDEVVGSFVEHGETVLQSLGDVVGIEDRKLGGTGEPVGPHHADIHPGDYKDARAAVRRGRNRANRLGVGRLELGVRGRVSG